MNSVLISIRPKWCEKIVSGEKTIEIRKTAPKIATPFKCYIYCTESGKYRNRKSVKNIWINRGTEQRFIGNGNIIGEFVCDEVYKVDNHTSSFSIENDVALTNLVARASCLDFCDMQAYARDRKVLFAWHISKLQIYDEPRPISDFKRANRTEENSPCAHMKWLYEPCKTCKECNLKRPPQSWCYVEES